MWSHFSFKCSHPLKLTTCREPLTHLHPRRRSDLILWIKFGLFVSHLSGQTHSHLLEIVRVSCAGGRIEMSSAHLLTLWILWTMHASVHTSEVKSIYLAPLCEFRAAVAVHVRKHYRNHLPPLRRFQRCGFNLVSLLYNWKKRVILHVNTQGECVLNSFI